MADLIKTEKLWGAVILLYGDAGHGKSVTTLQTCELPCMYIMTEPRDTKTFAAAAQRPELYEPGMLDVAVYTQWQDAVDFLHDYDFSRYKTIVLDSISHLIGIELSTELENEGYEALSSKKKGEIEKSLTMRSKLSQEGFGALGREMLRFTNSLSRFSLEGKVVVLLARLEQNPKFNRALSAGPAVMGKEFVKHLPGFCDYIGLVEPRIDRNTGKNLYPPKVSFEGDGTYMAKWTGVTPEGGVAGKVLHITKILQVSRGLIRIGTKPSSGTEAQK